MYNNTETRCDIFVMFLDEPLFYGSKPLNSKRVKNVCNQFQGTVYQDYRVIYTGWLYMLYKYLI